MCHGAQTDVLCLVDGGLVDVWWRKSRRSRSHQCPQYARGIRAWDPARVRNAHGDFGPGCNPPQRGRGAARPVDNQACRLISFLVFILIPAVVVGALAGLVIMLQ